jgi:hypothetical protein
MSKDDAVARLQRYWTEGARPTGRLPVAPRRRHRAGQNVATQTTVTDPVDARNHCRMRILRLTAVAVAATAAVLVGPRAASAVQSLGLSLSSVPGSSPPLITASYRFLPQQQDQKQQGAADCTKVRVTFWWDTQLLGQVGARPDEGQGQCIAEWARFTPPSGLDGPGGHVVRAVNGKDIAKATFTITDTVAPAPAPPTQGSSPTAAAGAPSTSARPSESATQSSARPSASAPTSAEPLPSEVPTDAGSPAIVGAAMKPPSGGSIGTIIAIVVGVMTIACAGVLFALVIRRRPDTDEIPADAVTAEP